MIKANKTAIANSTRLIGDNSKKECFNECNTMEFNDMTAHDKPYVDKKNITTNRSKIMHPTKRNSVK